MATFRKLLKCFDFDATSASKVTLSDYTKVTLNKQRSLVQLQTSVDALGRESYPTGNDIHVKTAAWEVNKLVSWLKTQVVTTLPHDAINDADPTSVQARIHDGTDEFYWDGLAWVAAGASDWNTLDEVNINISSFTSKQLGFVINLKTTDGDFTPLVNNVLVLYEVDLPSYLSDWVYSTLIAQMNDNLRPLTDIVVKGNGTTTILVSSLALEETWDITSIDAVYDETNDPDHATNLLVSFVLLTGTITLASSVATTDLVFIRAKYKPVIAVQTHQDYSELAASPSVEFTSVNEVDMGEAAAPTAIMDTFVDPPVAVILPAPRRVHLDFTISLTSPLSVDLYRLADSLDAFLDARRLLKSFATGEERSLRVTDAFTSSGGPSRQDMHSGTMSFRLENVYKWLKAAVGPGEPGSPPGVGYGVSNANVDVQVGATSETVQITGGS